MPFWYHRKFYIHSKGLDRVYQVLLSSFSKCEIFDKKLQDISQIISLPAISFNTHANSLGGYCSTVIYLFLNFISLYLCFCSMLKLLLFQQLTGKNWLLGTLHYFIL
jgi:hypothetical protein